MRSPYKIEIYAGRRGLLARRQWHARVVSTRNGKRLFRSSEGYNNQAELIDICKSVHPGLPVEIMNPPGAVPMRDEGDSL